MRHGVKKIKFKNGKDANKMMVVKLVRNFLNKGKLKITLKRAKVLRSVIDRIVSQAKKGKKELVAKKVNDTKLIGIVFDKIVPVFDKRNSGFVKFKKLGYRLSDGSEMVEVSWAEPIIIISETQKKTEQHAKTNKNNQNKKSE
jgi:large subunit ribosomal protein L17